jgi:hypothetical protein
MRLEPHRPAARIIALAGLSCPPRMTCVGACGLEGNAVVAVDKDICDVNDDFQQSFLASMPFAIGGPGHPDLDGLGGRVVAFDWYRDGGSGLFETHPALVVEHIAWDGRNDTGNRVASGSYILRVVANSTTLTQVLNVLR